MAEQTVTDQVQNTREVPPTGGVEVHGDDNVLSALLARAAATPNAPALIVRGASGAFGPISTSAMVAKFRAYAAGLVAAGVEAGDCAAIFSHASIDWALVD